MATGIAASRVRLPKASADVHCSRSSSGLSSPPTQRIQRIGRTTLLPSSEALLRRSCAGAPIAARGARVSRLKCASSYSSDRDVNIPKSTIDPATVISVNRKVGEGSFGQVFEVRPPCPLLPQTSGNQSSKLTGKLTLPRCALQADMESRGGQTKVVMKKMKANVSRSDEMGEVEIALGKLAAQKAKGATAQYLGHMVVGRKDAKPSSGLSEGLWLVRACGM